MASIYESQGPQVQLGGPSFLGGFNPVRAYDPSEQMLRAVEQQARLKDREIEQLTTFSNTLNTFLVKQAEEYTQAQMKLGVAEVMNGDITIKPEAQLNFKAAETTLAERATQDANLSDSVAEVSPAVAEQARADSPAINGWRSYGQAIGRAKLAAASSQMIMSEFMDSDQKVVPITNPDGTTRTIAPMEARTPAEIMAAFAVGQQMFIDRAGLSRINPVIIAEHLTPTMIGVKQSIVSNKVAAARKEMQDEAIESVRTTIGAQALTLNADNPDEIQTFWQTTTRDLAIRGRLSRGEANKVVVEDFINNAKALGRNDLLEALARTPLIADQPNGPTVGDRFRPEFEAADRDIEQYNNYLEEKKDKEQDDMVDDLLSAHQLLLTQPNIGQDQIQSSWTNTTDQLRKLATAGNKKATNALTNMLQEGENYNPLLAADLARDIASGRYPSESSINELVRLGRIKASEAADLKNRVPSSASVEKTKALEPEIRRLVRGVYGDALATQGINVTDAGSSAALLEGQMADELSELTQRFIEQNPNTSPAEVRDFLRTRADALIKQPRFTPIVNQDGKVVPKAPLSNNPRVQRFLNPVTGKQTRDFSTATPAQVQSSRPVSKTDWLISSQELAQNTQNFLNGQQPTPRVRALMTATGKSWDTFLRDQSQAYGIPFTQLSQSQAAQAAQQRRALAPTAAAILVNPNATTSQRIRAWNDINAARQRQLQRDAAGKTFGPGQDLKPGSMVQISDYLRLAKQQGLSDEQSVLMAAIGMAESTGKSNARLIGGPQPGADPRGLWQINMAGPLGPDRLKRYGLRNAEELDDPETNARVMRNVLKDQGITAWESYTDGRYRQYLPEARRALAEIRRSGFNSARSGGRANFTPQNVQSIRIETKGNNFQPGLDLWFADKQFGAFLPGRVKEIRQNAGNYGNLVIVESTDPETGDRIDVLYSHLDNINVREGQRINVGTVIGKQGGTGRVSSQDGTIASVDFLTPAPRGSNAMTPYPKWKRLAERIKTRIESGSL